MITNIFASIKETRILQELYSCDHNLYEYVEIHCQNISKELDNIDDFFREYTDHSSRHSLSAIRLGDQLLNNINLSVWEIAVFVLAAFHHDIGMRFSEEEHETVFESTDYKRLKPFLEDTIISSNQLKKSNREIVEKYIKLEWVRRHHHQRSYDWLMEKYSINNKESYYKKDINLWQATANVCRGHCLEISDLRKKPYSTKFALGSGITIDLVFITALLRLSDICHFSRDRALPYIRNSIDFYSKKSQEIWMKYGEISDTMPDAECGVIKIKAICTDPNIHRAIIDSAKPIDLELKKIHRLLYEKGCNNSFIWKFVDTTEVVEDVNSEYYYNNTHFKLNYQKITELLMGSRLYRSELFALRECIQNSVDANTIYQIKSKQSKNYVIVKYNDSGSEPILEIIDNGTGMDLEIIKNHLFSIGSDSYWFTERSYKDWGGIKEKTSIIATHGIGFLSTFMLADKIEVFSKYPDKDPIHLEIDSYKTGAIYKKTSIQDFPTVSNVFPMLDSPWNQGHGTCIRLYLKKRLSKVDAVSFLSKHIPRIEFQMYLSYNNETTKLKNIWYYPKGGTNLNEKESSLRDLKIAFYDEPKRDMYTNPPMDNAIENKKFKRNYITGIIYPKYSKNGYNYFRDQITQNGILINEGEEFIIKSVWAVSNTEDKNRYNLPFNFDINVTGKFTFDLDAERTHIIDNNPNRVIGNKISEILLSEYIKKISKIESSLYFPCGGFYYHGAESIFLHNQDMEVCFHKNLKNFFTAQKVQELAKLFDLNPLFEAKIFAFISKNRNESCSAKDIEKVFEQILIFLPNTLHVWKSNLEPEIFTDFINWYNRKICKSASRLTTYHNLVVIPDIPDSFTLPIISKFNVIVIKETAFYKLLKLEKKASIDFKVSDNVLVELSNTDESSADYILTQYGKQRKLDDKIIKKIRSNLCSINNLSDKSKPYFDLDYL